MPILTDVSPQRLSEPKFKEIAYQVTGAAFELHNRYGQFFSEKVFKYELADACRRRGFTRVHVESPVAISFDSFSKKYYVDLLVEDGALFELKTEQAIHPAHEAQTLNYLFLLELNRAKVFNFGAHSLEHRFVSTALTANDRRLFEVIDARWTAVDVASERFREVFIDLLHDWGSCLQLPIYYDAIIHFFGGQEAVIKTIPVVCDERHVTTQRAHMLNSNTAFKLTAFREDHSAIEEHLQRFLRNTALEAIQWINMNGRTIEFVTLAKDGKIT